VADLGAGQISGQRGALGLTSFDWRCWGPQAVQLLFDGGQIGGHAFLEQLPLGRIELLGAAAEFPALQDGHLVGERVDLGLAQVKLPVLVGELPHQGERQRAQLLCIEMGKGGGIDHGLECAARCVCPPIHAIPDCLGLTPAR